MAKTIETTPASEWTVPNQAALELVVDARIAKLMKAELSEAKVEAVPPAKDDKTVAPKS